MGAYRVPGQSTGGPMDFLHPALPMLHPHAAAALWSQANNTLDPQQQELLRNLTLTQLQHGV